LLRRWTNAAGRLHSFAIRDGRVVCSERAPEYTGFEHGLYALIANALGFSEDLLEQRLFSPIDNNAAKVLEKLEAHAQITDDDHIAWTFFLSSLRIRQPDVLDFLRTEGMRHLKGTMAERDAATLPEGWPTTEEWFNENFPGVLETASLVSWLPNMITHEGVLDAFGGLKWWYREFEPAAPELVLSDLPIHWEGGFEKPGFMIHLPIGPHRLFFGTRSEETEQILSDMPPGELITRVNRTSLASSAQRIWASTRDEPKAFIQEHRGEVGKNVMWFHSIAPWAKAPADA
jgi:hypothetical protein